MAQHDPKVAMRHSLLFKLGYIPRLLINAPFYPCRPKPKVLRGLNATEYRGIPLHTVAQSSITYPPYIYLKIYLL